MSERVLDVIQAGLVPYTEALAWQRALAQARIDGRQPHDVLLLVEHPPVVTVGRTARTAPRLRPDDERSMIDIVEVERGGDITYHGPGQLVGYPILDLRRHRPDLHWYLRALEQALIDGLADLGIRSERNPGYTGVWTEGRKIASIGVHVKQWVTWHGFALNVTTDLSYFDRIVPCGIPGVQMTSIEKELAAESGELSLWARTVAAVLHGFEQAFGVTIQETSRETV